MGDMMTFPNTVEEFMEQYKIVDTEKIYTNGAELVPIFRMMQWFEHVSATDKNVGIKISREPLELARAIDGLTEWQKHVQTDSNINRDITVAIEALKAQLGTNLAEVGTDCISRQAAIEVIDAVFPVDPMKSEYAQGIACGAALAKTYVEQLPSAQPEQHLDEWCDSCKEYDHENSCCPRWTKVIRQTRRELQDEFVMTAVDGTLWVTVDDVQKVGRVIVDEEKSKFCRQFYMDAQEQRTGKWIPQDHNKRVGNISTCVYYYPICSKCGQVGIETYKYCPHCGAKMISEGKTCDCYRDGTCIGTKEIDSCSCGGVKSKCDFYEHVRWEGDAE